MRSPRRPGLPDRTDRKPKSGPRRRTSLAKDPPQASKAFADVDPAVRWSRMPAPTSLDVVEFFACLGLRLCEALGMSETACLVATNTPAAMRFGSVGRAVDGAELRLDSDGELLIRGPVVMRGHRGMPEATREAIDPDGWLHTGDIARIDDDGFLWIVDRKKELLINAAGKNMSPTTIETKLTSAGPLISQACVIGDRRPYNVALLVLDPVASAGLNPTDPIALSRVADDAAAANDDEAQAPRDRSQVRRRNRGAVLTMTAPDRFEIRLGVDRRLIAGVYPCNARGTTPN
jgi:long-subunit acyl-CoA synthetase (AMP-forming)